MLDKSTKMIGNNLVFYIGVKGTQEKTKFSIPVGRTYKEKLAVFME